MINLLPETQHAIVDAAAEFLQKLPRRRAEHGHIDDYLERRFKVGKTTLHAILWEHPDFTRPDGFSLMYSPKEAKI